MLMNSWYFYLLFFFKFFAMIRMKCYWTFSIIFFLKPFKTNHTQITPKHSNSDVFALFAGEIMRNRLFYRSYRGGVTRWQWQRWQPCHDHWTELWLRKFWGVFCACSACVARVVRAERTEEQQDKKSKGENISTFVRKIFILFCFVMVWCDCLIICSWNRESYYSKLKS